MYQLGVKAMGNLSAGEVLAEARKSLGWSQAKLAETIGFSTVLISKIESGSRAPSEAFIQALSSHLPENAEAVREAAGLEAQPDKRKSGSLKIVDAMKLAKKNGERANRLKSRAEQAQREADEIAQHLEEKVKEFDREVVDPFSQLLSRVAGLPADAIMHADVQTSNANPQFSDALKDAQLNTSKSIFSLLGAGVLGSGAGAAVGPGAATATYMTVASIATASTGVAIARLSGAAASATFAAIRGGGLAAGGLGIAGGTALLTGLVAFPVIAAVAGTVLASGGRILETQKSVEQKIQRAETDFEANEAIVRKFITRAGRINEILTVALLAARNHRRTIERALPDQGDFEWSELDPSSTQASMRRVAEIVLACLTVLALPIGMNLKQGAPEDGIDAEILDEASIPRIAPKLEAGPELENEFIDYAIEQAFSQIAR